MGKKVKRWVDVPGGWRSGWPKLYDPDKDGQLIDWIRSNGYNEEIHWVRQWNHNDEEKQDELE